MGGGVGMRRVHPTGLELPRWRLVDAPFKAISSLKEIIVNVYDEPLSCDLREEMRGCGWTIEGVWEESESVGSYDEGDYL
jgi:hypothetical protein